MALKVLGIEISERLIKVCETSMGKKSRKVTACAMFQTPPEAVMDGEIHDIEAVAVAIKDNLRNAGIKNRKVVFTISSARIATREVTLPPIRDNKIKPIIEANASDYFPVDMSNYRITYTLQDRKMTGQNAGCKVLVMAAPISILSGYFSLATLLGFQIQALDYAGNSQYRLLDTQPDDGVTMYVDVDSTFSITTVMRKNRMLMQRLFPSGIDDYVLAYMHSAEKQPEDYLASIKELSSEYFMPDFGQTTPMNELYENLSRLVGNITRIADYFNSSNWETPIDNVVLTGIGANVVGLKNAIAESTGLSVSILPKVEKVAAPGGLAAQMPLYISALGCAINPLDLIPEKYSKKKKEQQKKKESISMGVTILVVCLLGAFGLSVYAFLEYQEAWDEVIDLNAQISELAYTENVNNAYLAYNKYLDDLEVVEDTLATPNEGLLDFIEELEEKMPAEVNVLSASCSTDGVIMNITVTSKTAAAKTIQQLRSFESIGRITVGPITEGEDDTGINLVSFSVECVYTTALPDENEEDNAAAEIAEDTAEDETLEDESAAD